MAATSDPIVLSAPKLIGTKTVAAALGLQSAAVRQLVAARDKHVMTGYLGKISERHTWNAHELFAGMYESPMALWVELSRVETGTPSDLWCTVEECEQHAHFLRLCLLHVNRLMDTWRSAERSTLAHWRLLAMCTWVVERNRHLTPPSGWDPFSEICMVPGCVGRTDTRPGRASPLCPPCSQRFWSSGQ